MTDVGTAPVQGFQPRRRTIRLEFADPEYAGLIIKTRSATTGEFLEITELAATAGALASGVESVADLADGMAGIRDLFTTFAGVIQEWNLLDDVGRPVPIGLDGLLAQDFPLVQAAIKAWMQGVAGVSAPLPKPSSDGGPSLEGSLPMEPFSSSRAS